MCWHPKNIFHNELEMSKRLTRRPKLHYKDMCKHYLEVLTINTITQETVVAPGGKSCKKDNFCLRRTWCGGKKRCDFRERPIH